MDNKEEKKENPIIVAEKENKTAKVPEKEKIKTIEDYYTIGKWGRHVQYKCNMCPFDSLEKAGIEAHIKDVHMPAPPSSGYHKPILDRFGNEMVKDEKGILIKK